jgi:hypothetical protein
MGVFRFPRPFLREYAMQATLERMPSASQPSDHEWEVYQFVAVRCKSTREAAGAFGISRQRVREVLTRVVEFLAEAIPTPADDFPQEQSAAPSPVALGKVCYLVQTLRVAAAAADDSSAASRLDIPAREN